MSSAIAVGDTIVVLRNIMFWSPNGSKARVPVVGDVGKVEKIEYVGDAYTGLWTFARFDFPDWQPADGWSFKSDEFELYEPLDEWAGELELL